MKKLAPVVAMILVGIDCVGKGIGINEQVLFSQHALWIWYIVALAWFIEALLFCFVDEY